MCSRKVILAVLRKGRIPTPSDLSQIPFSYVMVSELRMVGGTPPEAPEKNIYISQNLSQLRQKGCRPIYDTLMMVDICSL